MDLGIAMELLGAGIWNVCWLGRVGVVSVRYAICCRMSILALYFTAIELLLHCVDFCDDFETVENHCPISFDYLLLLADCASLFVICSIARQ